MRASGVDLGEWRLRLGPWIALLIGAVLVVWALVEKRAAVSWGDVYPGVAMIAAALLLFGILKYVDRPRGPESSPGRDEEPPGS